MTLSRPVDLKRYEMSDHLGNVTVVYSDLKGATISSSVENFITVEDYHNYYPFGMMMPGRNGKCAEGYRYGFNGQEKDGEILGSGNLYTAEFWQYDSRIGRRWNQDPKPNPSISNYATFANNPIWFSDPKGDTIKFRKNVNSDFKKSILKGIKEIKKTEYGAKVISQLENSKDIYYIEQVENVLNSAFEANRVNNKDENSPFTSGGTIFVGLGHDYLDGVNLNTKYTLGHELFHAYQRDLGKLGFKALIRNYGDDGFIKLAEVQAVGFENYLRASFEEYGFNSVRKFYTTKGAQGITSSIEILEYNYTKGWPQYYFSWPKTWSLKNFIEFDNVWLYGIRDKALLKETRKK